jgi:hypothetical protein
VCGYLIGLAVPLFPNFDLPLVFLVSLATLAALMGLKRPKPFRSLAMVPVIGFVAARLLSSMMAPHFDRNLHSLAPFLPALLLFYLLAEWVETKQQIAAIYVSLTIGGLVLATTLLVVSVQ